jgi:hypothetical protein
MLSLPKNLFRQGVFRKVFRTMKVWEPAGSVERILKMALGCGDLSLCNGAGESSCRVLWHCSHSVPSNKLDTWTTTVKFSLLAC